MKIINKRFFTFFITINSHYSFTYVLKITSKMLLSILLITYHPYYDQIITKMIPLIQL